jgi:hypothetical protein
MGWHWLWFAIPVGIIVYAFIFGIVAVLFSGVTSIDDKMREEDTSAAFFWPVTVPFFLGAKIFILIRRIPMWINQKRLDKK